MTRLSLIYGPDPIFRRQAAPVAVVDATVRSLVADMFEILYAEKGVGLGANMVGVLQRLIVIDLQANGKKAPLAMINPEILQRSEDSESGPEASLSFPGLSAEISRARQISVAYLDAQGVPQELSAEGFLARVIQHEMDYLDGRTFLDHLSRTRRQALLRKAAKLKKQRGLP